MGTGKKRIGIVGCGKIAKHHARTIATIDGIELAAVADLNSARAEEMVQEFKVPSFPSHDEMLRAVPDIDAVVISIPSGMHYEYAVNLMEKYRKSVIVEKPAFLKPSHMVHVSELAARQGVRLFPVFQNRYNRAVRRVQEALQNNELGAIRIASVRVRWCRPQRYYDQAAWRGTFAQDGGALTNQGVHHVDLLRYLCGEVDSVSCKMKTLGVNVEVEDTVVAAMTFKKDTVGALEVTTAARPNDYEASISLVCENGLAQLGGVAVNRLEVFTPDPSQCALWSEDFSSNIYGNGHSEVYKAISRSLNENAAYIVSEDDCLRSLKLLHAFYRADEQGKWVDVDSAEESTRLGRTDEALAELYRPPKL